LSEHRAETIELTKRYKNRVVVDHLNLEVRRAILRFLGPNGAVKDHPEILTSLSHGRD